MSTFITDVEDAIAAVLGALTVAGDEITAYTYEPAFEGMSVPCATLFLPDVQRPGIDEPEDQMGFNNWNMNWKLRLYHDLSDAALCQTQLKQLLADVIEAFDSDPTLGNLVFECSVDKATSGAIWMKDAGRPLMTYELDFTARRYAAI